ncbi:DUF6624 domain-containing protein [Streptomyces clavuligerus]|uniref:DUF6624 domain-containing protein n=2 Tax=Streptomyces clavuligerus TaxID=1901 RepID=UPI002379DA18|nr:DUF6624 domain-containing protein [Streptomyces clavuligerus]WDN55967.1 hypothetical protein LL058_29195 [Streptomyces clavuligerus]
MPADRHRRNPPAALTTPNLAAPSAGSHGMAGATGPAPYGGRHRTARSGTAGAALRAVGSRLRGLMPRKAAGHEERVLRVPEPTATALGAGAADLGVPVEFVVPVRWGACREDVLREWPGAQWWEGAPVLPVLARDLAARAAAWHAAVVAVGPGAGFPDPLLEGSNARALHRVIASHGWPDQFLVGREGAQAALEIALTCDGLPFLRTLLRHLATAVTRGRAPRHHQALLFDRVCVADGRPQRYGTQQRPGPDGTPVLWPVDEPGLLPGRRAGVGLAPHPGAALRRPSGGTAAA